MPFPFPDGFGLDVFAFTRNVSGYAKLGLRTAGFQDIFCHFIVPIGSFDKQLGLGFVINALLQFF